MRSDALLVVSMMVARWMTENGPGPFVNLQLDFTYLLVIFLSIIAYLLIKLIRYIIRIEIMTYYSLIDGIIKRGERSNIIIRELVPTDYTDPATTELINILVRQCPHEIQIEAIPSIINVIKILFCNNIVLPFPNVIYFHQILGFITLICGDNQLANQIIGAIISIITFLFNSGILDRANQFGVFANLL